MEPRLVLTFHVPSSEAGTGTLAPAGTTGALEATAAGPAGLRNRYHTP